MRRGTRTLRRPVLDRFTSVPLVCAPERLRLSVHGRMVVNHRCRRQGLPETLHMLHHICYYILYYVRNSL